MIPAPGHQVSPGFTSSCGGPRHRGAETSHPGCALSEFLTHRIHEQGKMHLVPLQECGDFHGAPVTAILPVQSCPLPPAPSLTLFTVDLT